MLDGVTRVSYGIGAAAALLCALALAATPAAQAQFGAEGASGPSVTTQSLQETDGAKAGGIARFIVVVDIEAGWHINANKPLGDFYIPTELTVEPSEGVSVSGLAYPEPEVIKFEFSDDELAVYQGKVPIGLVVGLAENLEPGDYVLKARLRYQACNDKVCAAPKTIDVPVAVKVIAADQVASPLHEELFKSVDFAAAGGDEPEVTPEPSGEEQSGAPDEPSESGRWRELAQSFRVAGRNSGYMGSRDFLKWVSDVESGAAGDVLGGFAGKSAAVIVLLTLVGGLALNLTPCVLPIIPINIAIIGAGAQSGSRSRGFALGGTYGVGMALVYGVLGVVAVLTGASFGTINASPWFNLGIAVLFVVLALAMFDIISIDFSRFQAKVHIDKQRGKGTFYLAFVMGCISALLAGACVAPVVIFVVLLARDLYATGTYIALGLPFLLGVGMALPWPLTGAGLSFLPKPGKWMTRVKYAFGVFILAFALYYGYQGYGLFSERYLLNPEDVQESVATLDEEGWTDSLEAGLARAQAENRPVLIDFWATWCKNCLTMNQTTFKDPEVKKRLEDYVKIKYRAQSPDESPARDVMEQFGVGGLGLPVYVILEPAEAAG